MYEALGLVGEAYGESETAKESKRESTKARCGVRGGELEFRHGRGRAG